MANYTIPESPVYTTTIRKLENSDPGNAEAIFNPLIQQLIDNTHAVKLETKKAFQAITNIDRKIYTVPSNSVSLTYNGEEQSPVWNSFDPEVMTITGENSATDAGTYTAVFTPKHGYFWASDGTDNAVSVEWTIQRQSIEIPAQSGKLTYTGSEQSPQWSAYSDETLTITGDTAATNAGTYTAVFTPTSNYRWSDGTTSAKSISWTIGKAPGSLSVSPSSMALTISNLTKTATVTRAGNGTISATSNNTNIATVSVSGTTITVTGKAKGSATITVKVAVGTNHTAPANKTISVTVNLPSKTLEENTPAVIQATAKAGQAPNYWSIGNKIGITLNGTVGDLSLSGTYYAFILGFNHNDVTEGSNSIHFQFGMTSSGNKNVAFVDSKYNNSGSNAAFRMKAADNNNGGWNSSYIRNTICPAFLSAMPTAWRNVITECRKLSDNTGRNNNTASSVTATSDKIFLLSEFEVFGTRTYANNAEQNYQKQYNYYKNGNSKIRFKHNDTFSACYWWLRSPHAASTSSFCLVHPSGIPSDGNASYSLGFAPGFVVA